MNNWNKILTKRHEKYYDDQKHGSLFCNEGMSKSAIREFKKKSGFAWCDEFFDLYSQHDGVGLKQTDNGVLWYFIPSVDLPQFRRQICQSFEETHPQISTIFFPFYDWANGDAIGYINSKEVEGILFEFQHEEYTFDPEQEVTDFIKPVYESIADFLKV